MRVRHSSVTTDRSQASGGLGSSTAVWDSASDADRSVQVARGPKSDRETTLGDGPNGAAVPLPTWLPQEAVDEPVRVVDFPPSREDPIPKATFHALQEWEGYIVEIADDHFVSRLLDITAGSPYEEEEAIIPLAEIAERDFDRVELGSIFRWVIGYERSATGTKKRVSEIVFRDLPAITEADLREGEAWAGELIRSLSW